MRSLGWALIQYDWCPSLYEEDIKAQKLQRKDYLQRERDNHLSQGERPPNYNPADSLTSDS